MTQKTTAVLTLCELADPGIPGLESYSPFCLKAHRALRLAGLDYTRRHGGRPDAFKDLNPAAQVPVLLVGDEPIADSTEILRRIDTLVPGSMSGRGDARARADAWHWEEYADTVLNGFLVAARWADDRNWPAVRDAYFAAMPGLVRAVVPGRIRARVVRGLHARDVWRAGPDRCWERFGRALDEMEARAPERGFWVGGEATAADVSLFGQLQSFRTDLTPWQRGEIERRARLAGYLDRVDARTRAPEALARAA
jgi:glutathione S-transferase